MNRLFQDKEKDKFDRTDASPSQQEETITQGPQSLHGI